MQNRNAFTEILVRRFVRANRIPAVLPPRAPRLSASKRRWSGLSLKALVLLRGSARRSALGGTTLRENLGQHPQPARDARQMNRTRFQCPNGATENSPAFQRWVNEFGSVSSPAGTAELCVVTPTAAHDLSRPYGTRFSNVRIPTVETVGYFQASLRDWNGVNAAFVDGGSLGRASLPRAVVLLLLLTLTLSISAGVREVGSIGLTVNDLGRELHFFTNA